MSSVETGQMSAVETGQMSAAETGQMSAVETRQMSTIATGRCPVLILYICLVSTADICPVSTADISISIDHSASAFRINNQHIMEAATAADLTQASEIAGRYITLGSAARASRPVPGLVLEVQVPPKMSVRAQIIKNGPNRVQNRRFGLKTGMSGETESTYMTSLLLVC